MQVYLEVKVLIYFGKAPQMLIGISHWEIMMPCLVTDTGSQTEHISKIEVLWSSGSVSGLLTTRDGVQIPGASLTPCHTQPRCSKWVPGRIDSLSVLSAMVP